jgi:hypothetical protein
VLDQRMDKLHAVGVVAHLVGSHDQAGKAVVSLA